MILLLPLLVGCGDPVSNQIFEEDADFYAALPAESRQTVAFSDDTTDEEARGLGERADLVDLSVLVAADENAFIFTLLGVVDTVRTLPPAARTEDTRRWGPYSGDCGVDYGLLIARTSGVYDWSVSGHAAGEDEAIVLYGTHYAGTTVAGGDGRFVWDHSRWAAWCGDTATGLMTVDYDNREGVDLIVNLDDWSTDGSVPRAWTYSYARTDDAGDFQFRTETDLADDGSDDVATVTVRDRWIPGDSGRSDATVTGGGFGDATWRWSQCWDGHGRLTWQEDSLNLLPAEGDAAECPFAESAEVDRI